MYIQGIFYAFKLMLHIGLVQLKHRNNDTFSSFFNSFIAKMLNFNVFHRLYLHFI